MEYAKRLLRGKKYSQDNIIPFVVLVIGSFGGIAQKHEVEEKMYKILEEEFSSQVYHEAVPIMCLVGVTIWHRQKRELNKFILM